MPNRVPSYEQLIAYAAGELNVDEARAIETQIARDPSAGAELARVRRIVANMRASDLVNPPRHLIDAAKSIFAPKPAPVGEPWWQRVADALAALVFDSRRQPALAGFRGSQTGVQMAFESELAEVDLQLEPPLDESGAWRVFGQISPKDKRAGVSIALLSGSTHELVHESQADADGVFSFDAAPGSYEIRVHAGGQTIVLPDVLVGR